ncbi:MAG: hypothetical protein ACYC1D_13030 [Acidimicrobiales bacterium]
MRSRHLVVVVVLGHNGQTEVIAVAAISASVSLTLRWIPALRQSATSRAHAPMIASLIGYSFCRLGEPRVSPRRAREEASAALSTPSSSSPMVTTETPT